VEGRGEGYHQQPMDSRAAQSQRKAWRRGAIAVCLGLVWVGACNLNPQPIPPGDTAGDSGSAAENPGAGGSADSGPGNVDAGDAKAEDPDATPGADAGDGGDATPDAGDGGDAAGGDGG